MPSDGEIGGRRARVGREAARALRAARTTPSLVLALCLFGVAGVAGSEELAAFAPPPRPPELRVPIEIVPAPDVAPLAGTPITTGVPFAEGWLAGSSGLRLETESGTPVPVQFSVRGGWPRTGGVRWLGVDFLLAPGAQRYTLVAEEGAAPAPASPVEVEEASDSIVIRTGHLRAEIPRRGALLRRVWWRGELALEQDEANWFTHLADGRRASDRGDLETRAEVELAGPLHTVVRVDGHYRGADGDPVPRWTARLHFHAGRPTIGITHTFTWVGAAEALQIRELALGFRLARAATHAAVDRGPLPGDGAIETELGDGGELALLQDRHFAWGTGESRSSVLSGSPEGAKRLGGGERAGAWIDASDARSGVALVMRDLWKQHPKELRAAADGLTAFLWSGRGESPPLDLRFDALESLFGPRLMSTIRTQRDREQWKAFREPRWHDPTGMSKSHDLLLVFHDGDWRSGGVEAFADAFDHAPLALPAPSWTARSGVLGPVTPLDSTAFPDLEARVSAVWDDVVKLVEDFGDFGFFGFGSGPHHAYEMVQGRAVARAWRFTGGIEYGYTRAAWLAWLRSGKRSLHDLAAARSRYLNDVVLCHEDSGSRRRGDWYWTSGIHLIPWGGAHAEKTEGAEIPTLGLLRSFGFHIEHALYRWYLTGDARSLEVTREYATALKAAIVSRPGWAEAFVAKMNTEQSRHAFQRLEELAVLWEQLGDPWFRSEAERLAGLLILPDTPAGIHLEPPSPGGSPRASPYGIFYKVPNLLRYAQVVDGEPRKAASAVLVRLGEYSLRTRDAETRSLGLRMGAAFALSGDSLFLDFARALLQRGEGDLGRLPESRSRFRIQLNGVPSQAYNTISNEVALMAALGSTPQPPQRVPALSKEPGLPAADVVLQKAAGSALAVQLSATGVTFERPDGSPWPESWTRAQRDYAREGSRAPLTWRDVRVPADAPAGAYRVRVSRDGDAAVLTTDASGLVLAAPEGLQVGGETEPRWFFDVPRDITALHMRASDLDLVDLRNARGDAVPLSGDDGRAQVRVSDRDAGLWSVSARRPTAVALGGVPPVFSQAPERWFADVAPAPTKATASTTDEDPWPEGFTGRGLRLSGRDSLVIPAGDKLADGRFQSYDAREGTLEFWLRPDWDFAWLPSRSVKGLFALEADDGGLEAYYRRAATSRGEPYWELFLDAAPPGGEPIRFRAVRGPSMRWTPDTWVHVALVWLPGKKGQRWALYVDGARRANWQGGTKAEWPSFVPRELKQFRVGAAVGWKGAGSIDGVIDALRISSIARYAPGDSQRETRFEPPRALEVDEHTLALFPLEGNTRGRDSTGRSIEAEVRREADLPSPGPKRRVRKVRE